MLDINMETRRYRCTLAGETSTASRGLPYPPRDSTPRSNNHSSVYIDNLIRKHANMSIPSDHGDLSHLLPTNYRQTIRDWLEEDCPSFDYGGFVVGEDESVATLYGKSPVPTLLRPV